MKLTATTYDGAKTRSPHDGNGDPAENPWTTIPARLAEIHERLKREEAAKVAAYKPPKPTNPKE